MRVLLADKLAPLVSGRLQDLGLKIGFALVLALMLFATYNDRVVVSGWLDRSQVENQSR